LVFNVKIEAYWFLVFRRERKRGSFFDDFIPQPHFFFGWIPLDENGRESFPKSAVNGSSFQNGNIEEEHMRLLNLEEVE
jgi:hypothetical protein